MKIPFPKYDAALVEEIEAHLDQDYLTEIHYRTDMEYEVGDGLVREVSMGVSTPRAGEYVRPMFQLMAAREAQKHGARTIGCPDCYDFARTSNCAIHFEKGGQRFSSPAMERLGGLVEDFRSVVTPAFLEWSARFAVRAEGNEALNFDSTPWDAP